jgi:hypothetical protein
MSLVSTQMTALIILIQVQEIAHVINTGPT